MVERPEPSGLAFIAAELPMYEPCGRRVFHVGVEAVVIEHPDPQQGWNSPSR